MSNIAEAPAKTSKRSKVYKHSQPIEKRQEFWLHGLHPITGHKELNKMRLDWASGIPEHTISNQGQRISHTGNSGSRN